MSGSKHIDADLYKAATKGDFEPFKNHPQPLDHLLTGKNQNSILHVHLDSPFERSKDFVEKVLCQCPHLLWQINNDGDTPLHIAAKYAHFEIVKLLIEEAKNPIHRDLETGEEEAVRRVLRLRNKHCETALHLACTITNSLCVVREILKHEDPNYAYTANVCGESPLYIAANRRLDQIAIEILNKFKLPDCSGPNGTTIFHVAAIQETLYFGALSDLLFSKLGNFINQADESGWTPLHYAAYSGNNMITRRILEADKRAAYATDKERNRTALHMATCRGRVDIMNKLIENYPECCEMMDARGWNVLHYAVISKCEKAIKTILKDPSLVYLLNRGDIKGYTPFNLILASDDLSALFDWLRSEESAVPSKFCNDQWRSISCNSRSLLLFPLDEDRDRDKKEVLEWMKDLGKGPLGTKFVGWKHMEETENEAAEKIIPELEKAKDSHLVVSALVATVTFAAAFTVPGGYISDESNSNLTGTPILSRNAAFKAFVVTDAIAMVLSTFSVFIHFVMVLLGYKLRYYWLIRSAFWSVMLAMGAMVVAFVTGTYAVLAPNSKKLAIVTCVIGLAFFVLVFYASIKLVFDFIKRNRAKTRSSSVAESLLDLIVTSPPYLTCGSNWFYFCYWFYM